MAKVKQAEKVILFTCNWHAFSSLEAAGKNRSSFSAEVVPIRLPCLGRLSTGIILKAFENGAAGVLMIGCPESHCQYQNGNLEALKILTEAQRLLSLLGYGEHRLAYQQLEAERGAECLEVVSDFLDQIRNGRDQT